MHVKLPSHMPQCSKIKSRQDVLYSARVSIRMDEILISKKGEILKHQRYEQSYIENNKIVDGLLLPLEKMFKRKNI